MVASRFLLKTAPPKLGRALPARPRLERRWAEINDRTAILVTAPQGFGKTVLLAQWRRRWLERGAFVAWATLDAQDERSQFVDLLAFALRGATGKDAFTVAAMQGRLQENRELDALTAMLAEVAGLATPTVVILDDAHRMPQVALGTMLSYLLNNAPPNLQFAVGTRRPLELDLADLLAGGQLASIGANDLRLDPEESREVLRARFGRRIGLDGAARLHDLTEGWPLGLQLAAVTVERANDVQAVIGQLSAQRGDIQRFFFETMLTRMPADESAFIVRVSILESMNADLCTAVTGFSGAASLLEEAALRSPVVAQTEDRQWFKLHAMARDFLLGQFDRLPIDERRGCYERAAAWYAAHDQLQEAARHAWAAGNEALAIAHATRCLRDIAREGRLGDARDWIRRIPATVMARDVGLQLTAAWISALGDAPDRVPDAIEHITGLADCSEEDRFEAALVSAAAAIFCDKPGLVAEALRGWDQPPPGATPLHVMSLANSRAMLALHSGEPGQVRQLLCHSDAAASREPSMRLPMAFADVAVALSHVWEGNPARATLMLQPALADAEREMGRRSVVSAMFAAVLSAVTYLRGDPDGALALLADRLDVIERVGMPDPIVLAYRVLAESAMHRGDDVRATEALEALHDLGVARGMPRLVFAALVGQVRLHVQQSRIETAADRLAAAVALRGIFEAPEYRPFLHLVDRRLVVATASLRLASGDARGAEAALSAACQAPAGMGRSPDALVGRALWALALHQLGRPGAREMLSEIISLAELGGMRWIVETAHPGIEPMLGCVRAGAGAAVAEARPAAATPARPETRGAPATVADGTAASGLLTPKEAHILSLLAAGMANKEIARAMDIGEQTVKWHLKNVFAKLNAASRRHAVDRAKLLGLISA
jgi:LuxR family transcriptional regulator, maltose regulon positive regulatory protein